jgi:hypothetical protein
MTMRSLQVTSGRIAAQAALLCAFFLLVVSLTYRERGYGVVLRMSTNAGPSAELYFASEGEGYSPDRRVPFVAHADGRWHEYVLDIPASRPLHRLRIDPGIQGGRVSIALIEVVDPSGKRARLEGADLRRSLRGTNQVQLIDESAGALVANLQAGDPYLDLVVPRVSKHSVWPKRILASLVASALCLGLLVLMHSMAKRSTGAGPLGGAGRFLDRVGDLLSEPGLLQLDRVGAGFLLGLLVGSVVYIGIGLNQSSIGLWEQFYPAQAVEQTVDLGDARRVRSDEWNTQTPWILNQVQRGSQAENPNIGGERAPLLAAVPVKGSVASLQPKFLGFALLDLDRGFSWWWAYKTIGLVAAFFWLLMLLTRGNTLFSILGALWIYVSSFTQWWLSSNLAEIMIAFALATVGGYYLLFAHRRRWIVTGGVLAVYAAVNLVLHLYPPFILPLAYLGVFILAGECTRPGATARIASSLRFRAVVVVATVTVIAGALTLFLIEAQSTIEAMMATVYPGKRVAVPGSMPIWRVMYAWFEAYRFGEDSYPAGLINASEASSFVILAPIAVLVFHFRSLVRRENAALLGLLLYSALVLAWMCVPLPSMARNIAMLMGWGWSPPARSMVGLGLASILACTVVASSVASQAPGLREPNERRWLPFFAAACIGVFGWGLRQVVPAFASSMVIAAGMFTAFALTSAMVNGSRGRFALGVALLLVPGLAVNPLMSGLSSVMEKPILVAAKQAGGRSADRWVVVGDFVFAQGLKAIGLDVLNGSHMVPDMRKLDVLDPANAYSEVWNRYAHVIIKSSPSTKRPLFDLVQPDLYTVSLDICGDELRRLGVTHVAYTVSPPPEDFRCLKTVRALDASGVSLYQIVAPTTDSGTTNQ